MITTKSGQELERRIEGLLWRFQQENPGIVITKDTVIRMCVEAGLDQIEAGCRIAGYSLT